MIAYLDIFSLVHPQRASVDAVAGLIVLLAVAAVVVLGTVLRMRRELTLHKEA